MKLPSFKKRGMIAVTAMILFSIMVVTALSTAELAMLQVRGARNISNLQQARLAAISAIDYCLYLTTVDAAWRSSLGSGQWVADYDVGPAKVTVDAEPVGGEITDPAGEVLFTAAAGAGNSKQTVSVQARPRSVEVLQYLLCGLTENKMELNGHVKLYGDVRAAGRIESDGTASLKGNIYTARPDWVQPFFYDGDTTIIAYAHPADPPPLDLAWYRTHAQEIVLPTAPDNSFLLSRQMLTDTVNPYGPAHPEGLYYMQVANTHVVLEHSFITGTLVIDGAHTVTVRGGYRHRPASADYPAIITTGRITVEISDALGEAEAAQDFNADGDTDDVLMSRIDGLVYCGGRFTGFNAVGYDGEFRMHGAIVAGEIRIADGCNCWISYDPALSDALIPGFQRSSLAVMPGSLQ